MTQSVWKTKYTKLSFNFTNNFIAVNMQDIPDFVQNFANNLSDLANESRSLTAFMRTDFWLVWRKHLARISLVMIGSNLQT